MPFLFLIGLYAVRIATRPLDVRLKKRHAGPMAVVAVWIVLYLAWDWLKPAGTGTVAFVGEFAGVTAVYLMVWALVLATRVRWLEQWFGGLDRMYLWHKTYALWSMVLLVPHIVLSVLAEPRGAGYVLPPSVFQGHVLGVVSAVVMFALVLVSLARVGRILRLPYAWWLLLHRLIGLLVLGAVVHGWLVDPIIGGSLALQTLYIGVGAVGMAAYAYDELVMRWRTPRAEYTVRAVERPSPDIVDVTLAPAGPAALRVRGGQFVYLRVGGHRAWREHPFSVAGTEAGGCVRLTVRALGRDTRRLYTDLTVGLPATLGGPYGMFDYTLGGDRQIWIAGGIGIAPFLGWLGCPDRAGLPRADLFYCTPGSEEAPFLSELTAAAARQPGLRIHPVYSGSGGRLTVPKIEAAAGPLTPDTHVFLCGPATMVESLAIALRRRGIRREHLHAEHFAFR